MFLHHGQYYNGSTLVMMCVFALSSSIVSSSSSFLVFFFVYSHCRDMCYVHMMRRRTRWHPGCLGDPPNAASVFVIVSGVARRRCTFPLTRVLVCYLFVHQRRQVAVDRGRVTGDWIFVRARTSHFQMWAIFWYSERAQTHIPHHQNSCLVRS